MSPQSLPIPDAVVSMRRLVLISLSGVSLLVVGNMVPHWLWPDQPRAAEVVLVVDSLFALLGMAFMLRLQWALGRSRMERGTLDRDKVLLAAELQAIFDAAPMAILIIRDHVIEHANPAAELISGYPRTDITGMPLYRLFSAAEISSREGAINAVLLRGDTYRGQTVLRCKDGSKCWLNISGRSLEAEHHERRSVWILEDVGAFRDAEKKLLEAEQRWQFAIEGAELVAWDWDLARKHIWYSPRWPSMLACGPEDIKGTEDEWRSLVHPEDLGTALEEQSRHFRGETGQISCRYRVRRTDGEYVWVQTWGRIVERDRHGQPLRMTGITTDISERHAAEQALHDSEKLYRSLGEALPMGVFRIDRERRIVYANRYMARAQGLSDARELIGRDLLDFVPMHARGQAEIQHRQVIDQGQSLSMIEQHVLPATLHSCYLEITRIPVSNEAGEITGEQGVFRDVTDQVMTEQQLRLTSLVFESAHQGVVICDTNHTVLRVNRGFTRITGYEPDEVIGKPHSIMGKACHDESFPDDFKRSLEHHGHWEGETVTTCKGGRECDTFVTTEALRGADGKVCNYVTLYLDISERKASQERIRYLAQHDQLTGLPNRTLLRDRVGVAIEAARRSERRVALLFLDLDRFKNINDSLGHEFGDKLLSEAARRLSATVRSADTVSRHGGDEFIVMLPEVGSDQDVKSISRKLIDAVGQPYSIDGKEAILTLSIGIAMYPQDGNDIDMLLRNADTALYATKQAGRNHYRFYTSEMNTLAAQRLQTENELRRAVERGELYLHYQPQVDLDDLGMVGAEALVRWQHPVRGMVSPGEFIPIAEDSGLIVEIGNWVMETACRQYASWLASGLQVGSISVNVSGHQFRHRGFVPAVLGCLERTGLDPARLELEVTETVIMHGSEHVLSKLKQLAALGVRLAIDDFGTGYSSLSYLKLFPLDRLKVDQAFVRGLPADSGDAAIVRAVVGLGHNLELNVLAEGIETGEQLEFLRSVGCNVGQGYHFSRPLSSEAFEKYVRAQLERRHIRLVSESLRKRI
jgi:diguanylate cyclase (GGDEF)-like protein/PAS domain S-box-containing protein